MAEANEQGRSLLQLAISLRVAAQRLAESASRMQQAAGHQRQQLERLTLLRDRIVELLGECRRATGDKPKGAAPKAPAADARPAPAAKPSPPPAPSPAARASQYRLPASAFVEFSNWQEFEKFRRMPPITDQEVTTCDLEALIRRLAGD